MKEKMLQIKSKTLCILHHHLLSHYVTIGYMGVE